MDIIPIAFVNQFANTGDGILGENFGSACWAGSYPGPGYDGVINRTADALPERCIDLQNDIPYCQANYDTKILISIGGAVGENLAAYGLGNETQGIALAEMLWYGYGPYNVTASGVLGDGTQGLGFIRPLDRGYNNTNYTEHVDVDGFDFDIETNSADEQLGYVACINHLRKLIGIYQTAYPGSKDYIISGAPQCPIPDAHMDVIIAQAQFDIIWVQFYNNDAYGCSARNYITSGTNSNFNLNSGATNWTSTLAQSLHSKDAKLYIGLPGGPAGSSHSPFYFSDYRGAESFETYLSEQLQSLTPVQLHSSRPAPRLLRHLEKCPANRFYRCYQQSSGFSDSIGGTDIDLGFCRHDEFWRCVRPFPIDLVQFEGVGALRTWSWSLLRNAGSRKMSFKLGFLTEIMDSKLTHDGTGVMLWEATAAEEGTLDCPF